MSTVAIETQRRREVLSAQSIAIRENVQKIEMLLQQLRGNIEETHDLLEGTRQALTNTLKSGAVRQELVPVIEVVKEIADFGVELFAGAPSHFNDVQTLTKAKAYLNEAEEILTWARYLAQEVSKPLPPAPAELKLPHVPGVPPGKAAGFISVAEARAKRLRPQ